MQVRLLLGPAGSGKTFRCLMEARQALLGSPEGSPLVLVTPKQTTYQLERRLLADGSVAGYTRLQILSFDRLAHFIFDQLRRPGPKILDEEGRLMVLRGLLSKKRNHLKLFRASARLTGFAQQLSLVLSELQRNQLTPEALNKLAAQVQDSEGLAYKLQDLAALLLDYLDWLAAHELQDADCLLASAAESIRSEDQGRRLQIERLWVDGFAEWSPQELDLLAALMPQCRQATFTFCLDRVPSEKISWLSSWSVVRKNFDECRKRFASLPKAELSIEVLERRPGQGRFGNSPVLEHLEKYWAEPRPYPASEPGSSRAALGSSLRVASCADPEGEVTLAAREILRHVRAGGRYRDVMVLVRRLAVYHDTLQRLFSRYGIPFFLDRRESVSHHPLAELTRSSLRTVVSQWRLENWFAALKTGLVPAQEEEIDRLENEALARGWQGAIWQKPISINNQPEMTRWLAELHRRLLPPFQRLALALETQHHKPTGPQLAGALRNLWEALGVEQRLELWAAREVARSDFHLPNSVHATVWEQMNSWLANVELAFPNEALSLRDWLPILEAGLANLTVGVIPPALDQVLIGAIDRSRDPDIRLGLLLGMNETLFPAPPESTVLLTELDRLELEKQNVVLGATARQQLGRERFLAYIACTRARQRLVLTSAMHDANGAPLNPSPFLSHVSQFFPALEFETAPRERDWRESEHVNELIVPLLKAQGRAHEAVIGWPSAAPASAGGQAQRAFALDPSPLDLRSLPAIASVMEQLRHFKAPQLEERLSPELAARLYGPVMRTSVSRIEQFAACPFKFFVHSGLRAEERKKFELDVKEQGTFQHEVLACFHKELREEKKRWRDITPAQARERIGKIAAGFMAGYRDGLLEASEESRFMARTMTESLQDFVETLVEWMRQQYQFDPVEVELPFGNDENAPAWALPLGGSLRLELQGRIDRVDLFRTGGEDEALCVVVDYKSSQKELDPVLMAHGLQLQLPAYLNVLRYWPNPSPLFGVCRLVPAGVFYVSLRGRYPSEPNRTEALADSAQARKLAYRHAGRFDARALRQLDSRPDARSGDQFNYRLNKDGQVNKNCREVLDTTRFAAMLDAVEDHLQRMGKDIFSGVAKVAPYRKGAMTACDQCAYQAICRIDPWTHSYRVLRMEKD